MSFTGTVAGKKAGAAMTGSSSTGNLQVEPITNSNTKQFINIFNRLIHDSIEYLLRPTGGS